MKNENKDILLKDLCARLPYGVVCHTSVGDYKLLGIDVYENEAHLDSPVYDEGDGYFDLEYGEVKPYLRQMSSMTMEERYEYDKFVNSNTIFNYQNAANWVHWLNVHHFDYLGLIEQGLALKAPEDMYITK